MFPSVIPLYGTDCSRVTHPSAARISSVQALQISPLDLHVLSTPPAFVLSQDQTLMFNPSQVASRPAGSPKPAKRSASLLSTLSESDCSCGSHPPSFDVRRSPFFLLCIVFKVRLPPSRSPLASRRGALVSSGVCYYINSHPLCQVLFFKHISPSITPIYASICALLPLYIALFDLFHPLLSLFLTLLRFVFP